MNVVYWLIRREATVQTPGQIYRTKRNMKNIFSATPLRSFLVKTPKKFLKISFDPSTQV